MKIPRIVVTAVAVAAAFVLAGCKDDQGRPISFNKGTYAGKTQPDLGAANLKALDSRVMLQSGGVSGPAQVARPTQEQPAPSPNDPALADRLQKQSGK